MTPIAVATRVRGKGGQPRDTRRPSGRAGPGGGKRKSSIHQSGASPATRRMTFAGDVRRGFGACNGRPGAAYWGGTAVARGGERHGADGGPARRPGGRG